MKPYALVLIFGFSATAASCQEQPQARITFVTNDDEGRSVKDAEIRTSTFRRWQPGEGFGKDINAVTKMSSDDQGLCVLETRSVRGRFAFGASKQGYYPTNALSYTFTDKRNDRWEPWNPTVKIELKRVLNPIPLIAKKVCEGYGHHVVLPADNAGYDLQIGDWTAPYGKGKVADINFHLQGRTNDVGTPYESSMKVSFSNAGDGLILHESDPTHGSRLRMPYLAPQTGYIPERIWRKARLAGSTTGVNRGIDQVIDETKTTENYFLRVRTRLNEKGEIISAHYAKIQGGFHWGPEGVLKFQYHFNPTPNNRNLEFDTSRNLLSLLPGEKVEEP